MPEDIDDLRKNENLSEYEAKIFKIFDSKPGKGFTLQEISDILYPTLFDGKHVVKEVVLGFTSYWTIDRVLGKLVNKGKIKKIFAKGKDYYYKEK